MSLMGIIFGLCLFCASTQVILRSHASSPQEVKSFCEVIAKPELSLNQRITLTAVAHVHYGGILLESDECKGSEVTLHFMKGYENESDMQAVEALNRAERKARHAHLRREDIRAEQTRLSVVLEGKFRKNPHYLVEIARGEATLAAGDYHYKYAFVVSRVVSFSATTESR